MMALALLLEAAGFVLIHAALTGKSLPEIFKAGLPESSATPKFGSKETDE